MPCREWFTQGLCDTRHDLYGVCQSVNLSKKFFLLGMFKMTKIKHTRSIRICEDVSRLAFRVTLNRHLDWKQVFGDKIVYFLSCYEVGSSGNHHTHSAIQLDAPMKRTTIIQRLQKHYPDLKGKEKFALATWDGDDAYLRYICKDLQEVYDREDNLPFVYYGDRWNSKHPMEYRSEYHLVKKELKVARKVSMPANKDISEFVVHNFTERHPHRDILEFKSEERRKLIAELIYEFYQTTEKDFHGNYFAISSLLNSIEFKIFKPSKNFKEFFISKIT